MTRHEIARSGLSAFFILSGLLHFAAPEPYRAIVPGYLPAPALLVAVSGAAEIMGGVGLLLPRWRVAAGCALLMLLVAVFPANVEMLRRGRVGGVAGPVEALLWFRLPLQAVLMWWVWRVSGAGLKPRRTGG